MPGASPGGGQISIFFIIRDRAFKLKYQYFHINQKNSIFFFYQGRHRGVGAIFLFSLLSNIDINIFILIRKIKKIFLFPRASQVGGGNIYIFSLSQEIGPSNINTNIFIFIRDIKKIYISLKTSIETHSSSNLSKFLFFICLAQSRDKNTVIFIYIKCCSIHYILSHALSEIKKLQR